VYAESSIRAAIYGIEKVGNQLNWKTVFESVQSIAKGSRDAPRALVMLRQEVVATGQLSADDKAEMHRVLDGLQSANLYGQIALVGQLKEVLTKYPEFTKLYAEYGMQGNRA
jgi:hypothetical protein